MLEAARFFFTDTDWKIAQLYQPPSFFFSKDVVEPATHIPLMLTCCVDSAVLGLRLGAKPSQAKVTACAIYLIYITQEGPTAVSTNIACCN